MARKRRRTNRARPSPNKLEARLAAIPPVQSRPPLHLLGPRHLARHRPVRRPTWPSARREPAPLLQSPTRPSPRRPR
eukprot:8854086-Alexandrium_andersonii.AAC.1